MPTRFGGVRVMMKRESTRRIPATIPAPMGVMSSDSGAASTQPRTPPARARASMPSRGSGAPLKMWQSAAMETRNRETPTPMRPLSLTEEGWRKSQRASSTITMGSANATRPKSPPNVYASKAMATSLRGLNHSTTTPAIASTTRRKGMPSRRSSFASFSGPRARKRAPVACARPIHAATSGPRRSVWTG